MRSGILIAVFIFASSVAGYSQAVARGDADSKCGWEMPQLAASSPKPSYARYNFAEGTVGVMCFEENQTYGIESDDDLKDSVARTLIAWAEKNYAVAKVVSRKDFSIGKYKGTIYSLNLGTKLYEIRVVARNRTAYALTALADSPRKLQLLRAQHLERFRISQ